MNRKIISRILSFILVTTLFLFSLLSCISKNNTIQKEQKFPKAYWNQEEHDRAVHRIHQPRETRIHMTFHTGEEESPGKKIKLFTGKSTYGSEDEYRELRIDNTGSIEQTIQYNHSYIGVELSKPLIPSHHGIHTILFSWYRPGTWIDDIRMTIDITHMYCVIYPDSTKGTITSTLTYPPDWEEKKVWVTFERLCAITSTPGEHPGGLQAREARISRNKKGNVTIVMDMPGFFKKWHKNFARPWKQGDTFTITLSLTLEPPRDLFTITPSDKQDPPFIPGKYDGKVDAGEGDPYLFVPSTTPLEEVIMETILEIPLTGAMLNF